MITTTDTFLDGTLVLAQPRGGMRAGSDTLMLARVAIDRTAERVVDLGAGVGTLGIAYASARAESRVVLLERQPILASLARENAERNGVSERVEVVEGDVRSMRGLVEPSSADLVICNPPYYPLGSGRLSPDPIRAGAHHELAGTLDDFAGAARYALRPAGELLLIYPPERLGYLMDTLRARDFAPVTMCPVRRRVGMDASALIVSARAGGGPPLRILPPLYVEREERS